MFSPAFVNCFSRSQAILLGMKYCWGGGSQKVLYLHYIENSIPNEPLGKSVLLTYFTFIVLFRTQGVFPAKASFFSFLAKSFYGDCSFPPPLSGSHHDDSPKDTLEGFVLIHILLNSPRSEKDLHKDLIKQILKANKMFLSCKEKQH